MSLERYRTVKEVADPLHVNEVIARRWIKDGEIRGINIDKEWIGPDDLDAFLEGHATRPAVKTNSGLDSVPEETGAQETKGQKN